MSHTECSFMKNLSDATKILSIAESVSEFSACNKTVKDNHMIDIVGGGHEASEVVSSRKKFTFALNDADGVCYFKSNIKIILNIGTDKCK